nr:MAG TPA: hypothetical protein [Caudoviricetes sp.]
MRLLVRMKHFRRHCNTNLRSITSTRCNKLIAKSATLSRRFVIYFLP